MAVPSSGELKLWDSIWNSEIGAAKGENSLHSASIYAGFSTPDALSDFYGWSDVEAPSVTATSATSVQWDRMTLNGNITDTGNEDPAYGFYFGTNGTFSNNPKTCLGTKGTGTFSTTCTGLTNLTTYYYWAFACNSAGEVQSGRITQQTPVRPFSATLANYTSLTGTGGGGSNVGASSRWTNPYSGGGNTTKSGSGTGNVYLTSVGAATNTRNSASMGASTSGGNNGIRATGGNFFQGSAGASNNGFNYNYFVYQTGGNTMTAFGEYSGGGSMGAGLSFCFSDPRTKTNIKFL